MLVSVLKCLFMPIFLWPIYSWPPFEITIQSGGSWLLECDLGIYWCLSLATFYFRAFMLSSHSLSLYIKKLCFRNSFDVCLLLWACLTPFWGWWMARYCGKNILNLVSCIMECSCNRFVSCIPAYGISFITLVNWFTLPNLFFMSNRMLKNVGHNFYTHSLSLSDPLDLGNVVLVYWELNATVTVFATNTYCLEKGVRFKWIAKQWVMITVLCSSHSGLLDLSNSWFIIYYSIFFIHFFDFRMLIQSNKIYSLFSVKILMLWRPSLA